MTGVLPLLALAASGLACGALGWSMIALVPLVARLGRAEPAGQSLPALALGASALAGLASFTPACLCAAALCAAALLTWVARASRGEAARLGLGWTATVLALLALALDEVAVLTS